MPQPIKTDSSSNDNNPYPNDKAFYGEDKKIKMPDTMEKWLEAANLGTRMLDAYSTRKMLSNPQNHEMFLPKEIADSTPAMYGYGAGVVGADMLGEKILKHFGHPKLAHALTEINIGSDLPWAINNFRLPAKPTSPTNTLKLPARPLGK